MTPPRVLRAAFFKPAYCSQPYSGLAYCVPYNKNMHSGDSRIKKDLRFVACTLILSNAIFVVFDIFLIYRSSKRIFSLIDAGMTKKSANKASVRNIQSELFDCIMSRLLCFCWNHTCRNHTNIFLKRLHLHTEEE